MDQEEKLRPHIEPSWGDLGPQVPEIMKNQHEIQESIT